LKTLADFLALADRYNKLTKVNGDDWDSSRSRNMKKALILIAKGQRDGAARLIGPYGFRWLIIEDLLRDIDAAGFGVDALVS
jgi:hypothetical protein